MFKNIRKLFFTNFAGKILGFIREILLAFIFGTSSIIDTFKLCNSLILTPLNLFVGNSLQQIYIPMYNQKKNKIQFVIYVSFLIMIISLILCLITIIYSKEIISLFLDGSHSDKQRTVGSNFLRIFALGIPFYVYNWIFIYTLNAQKNFKENGLNILNFNLVLIGITSLYIIFKNIYLLPLSFGVANLIIVIQLNIKYRKDLYDIAKKLPAINTKVLLAQSRDFLIKWSPLLVYTLFMQTYILLERWFLSKDVGLIAASEYAKIITDTPVFLITLPVATIGLTYFDKTNKEIFAKINKMFFFVFIASILLSVFIYTNQEIITKVLFMRGSFNEESLELVLSLLKYYSIGFCFYSINTFIFRIYNAEMRNKELSIIIIVAHLVSFCFIFLLYFLRVETEMIVGLAYILVNLLQTIVLKARSQSLSFKMALFSLNGKIIAFIGVFMLIILIILKIFITSPIHYFLISSIMLIILFVLFLNYIRNE